MTVIFSIKARADIEEIGRRIARDNPERAHSFVKELIRSGMALSEFPQRFPLVEEYADVRKRVHGNYLLIYRIEPEQITVLRVMHGTRDYVAELFPEE